MAEKSSARSSSLFWMLQFSLWGRDPTPSQHLAWLCQSWRLCWRMALAGLDSLFLSGASKAPGCATWTRWLPTPEDTSSLFLCLADPKVQLWSVSGQFPLVFFSLAFSEGSVCPIGIVHSCRSIDKWTFSAAWLPPLLSVPGLALLDFL